MPRHAVDRREAPAEKESTVSVRNGGEYGSVDMSADQPRGSGGSIDCREASRRRPDVRETATDIRDAVTRRHRVHGAVDGPGGLEGRARGERTTAGRRCRSCRRDPRSRRLHPRRRRSHPTRRVRSQSHLPRPFPLPPRRRRPQPRRPLRPDRTRPRPRRRRHRRQLESRSPPVPVPFPEPAAPPPRPPPPICPPVPAPPFPPVPLDFEPPHAVASAQPASKTSNARPARQPARGAANVDRRRVGDAGAITASIVPAPPGLLRRRPACRSPRLLDVR